MSDNNQDSSRSNVKKIFLPNALQVAINRFCGRNDVMEKPAMLWLLSEALHTSSDLSDLRFERLKAKYSFSQIQKQDDEFEKEKRIEENWKIIAELNKASPLFIEFEKWAKMAYGESWDWETIKINDVEKKTRWNQFLESKKQAEEKKLVESQQPEKKVEKPLDIVTEPKPEVLSQTTEPKQVMSTGERISILKQKDGQA